MDLYLASMLINLVIRIGKHFELHSLAVSDWTVVVAGITIVLGTLLLLILVFKLFGSVMEKTAGKSKKKAKSSEPVQNSKPVPTAPAAAPAPVVEQGISGEVVAAISAAVCTVEGSGSTITSIKTVRKQSPITGRNPWSQAAVIDNTRPF